MSYDIYFLRREQGQSWEDAMAALEEQAEDHEAPSRPARWDQVVSGVREVLGDVPVVEGPPNWEIDDEDTAIQVNCFCRAMVHHRPVLVGRRTRRSDRRAPARNCRDNSRGDRCVMRRSQSWPGSPVAMNLMTACRSWSRKLARSAAMTSKPLSREAASDR